MSLILTSSIAVLIAYILGSFPTSFIMGKVVKGIDIRDFGSGNVGATNALRILGTKYGVSALVIDMFKGFIAIFIGKLIIKEPSNLILILIGLAAILGHIFTIFLKFKGGKGVATSAGVFLALTPIAFSIAFIVFILIVAISKYVSLGSILASLVLLIAEIVINLKNSFADIEVLIMTIVIAFFVIIRHKANIIRLKNGNENKISFKK
ncbi:MAG: glycerol-3-phosphate 1-O-acyltransferase PlsY [Candidatus Cloacimonetes bacterium]|nr:glycerol-3-phosphate 1-O-acyltransferase PlsY [Candidatus Cloacimonadota bacterium]